MPAIYVHIPFCKQKCVHCDFNSYSGLDSLHRAYVGALVSEIALQAPALRNSSDNDLSVSSVYIGGGTPTLIDPAHIDAVLHAIANHFSITRDVEVSIEANPETITLERMAVLKEAGVNRLSIGFQSLDNRCLQVLGRKHSAMQAIDAFNAARETGFDNINIDLIFGIPGQTIANWASTLEQVTLLDPEHLSCYSLTIEPGTVLEREIAMGLVETPDEDVQADMFTYTIESLRESGFEHYEISNYAKLGKRCRHNLTYWNNGDYIGFGAGAHSKMLNIRFSNIASPAEYIKSVESGSCIAEVIDLSIEDEMSEMLFLGLRKTEGINLEEFKTRFGRPLHAVYGAQVDDLIRNGLVTWDDRLRLTSRGILFGNEVFSRFI
ncbi:MAG: radical SAM family heme chaperone HemW [Actinobacteria bacterium]|nr:radical SAM family heme chaperone HemW [Actinomycetota bacterium]